MLTGAEAEVASTGVVETCTTLSGGESGDEVLSGAVICDSELFDAAALDTAALEAAPMAWIASGLWPAVEVGCETSTTLLEAPLMAEAVDWPLDASFSAAALGTWQPMLTPDCPAGCGIA